MKIIFIRTGGFTGIPVKKTIDTQKLPPEKAKEIENLVVSTNFFSFETPHDNKGSPDRFIYTITITNGILSHTITIAEQSLTNHLQELITTLQSLILNP